MPWDVRQGYGRCGADEFAVVKTDTDEVVACHAMREGAERQVAALYADEPQAGRAELSAAQINDLPDSAFAYIEPGGRKDEQGKTVPRSLRHFPIHDAAHVRSALARAPQSPFGERAMPKIREAAKKFGVEMSDDNETSRFDQYDPPQLFVRSYPLEDIRILTRAQGSEYSDGRTVEAYAAVFDRETEIEDHEGHYREVIDRSAFNKAINDSRPQGGRQTWRTGVFYNHGMTLFGTPSDRFSVPLGSPMDIKPTDHGLLTVTRYSESPLADEILEAIRSGAITGQSFTGRIIRSDPRRPPTRRGYTRRSDGSLQTVRRLEMGLREYGPTPFPAYADAAVVGIRNVLAGLSLPALLSATRDAAAREVIEISQTEVETETARAAVSEPEDSDTSAPDVEAVSDESSDEGHSSRDSLLRRIAAAKATRPGLDRDPGAEVRRARVAAIARPDGDSDEAQGDR